VDFLAYSTVPLLIVQDFAAAQLGRTPLHTYAQSSSGRPRPIRAGSQSMVRERTR
jgi:hypothetical protein